MSFAKSNLFWTYIYMSNFKTKGPIYVISLGLIIMVRKLV